MKGLVSILATAALLLALPTAAQADFGLKDLDVAFTDGEGAPLSQAGAHPTMHVEFGVNTREHEQLDFEWPDEAFRDLVVSLPPGLVGTPTATPRCSSLDFFDASEEGTRAKRCEELGAQVGEVDLGLGEPGATYRANVYNLQPPRGVAAKLGFWGINVAPVTIEVILAPDPPYNLISTTRNTSNVVAVYAADLTLFANPAGRAFLTLPRTCSGPLTTSFEATSWQGSAFATGILTHDGGEPPAPLGMSGCDRLGFAPEIVAQPTSRAASSATGLDFSLAVEDEGLLNPAEGATAAADIEKSVVTLPRGMTLNPSQAEGLEVCTEAQLSRETPDSLPDAGCPQASKVGTIEVETPLLEGTILKGGLYVAEPYRNLAGDSLVAVYVVIRDAALGVKVVQPLRVEPDPVTGQLVTYAEDMPQLPFSEFRLRFREGARSPLITPPGCGEFEVEGVFYPHSGAAAVSSSSSFEIIGGPNGAPCPAGAAPFDPGFEAGTLNNAAGAYSPFHMRLARGDGEADLSRFSAVLPPGVVGRIAGIPWCPEAGIAQARSRTGEHGGQAELADPSCPAASALGRTVAGAGVGSQLTYVGGSLHLAGPYGGAPLSVVSITPAVAGPFDAGAVVVRVGLRLNPRSGLVEADGAACYEIPHILQGIPLSVRDLRVYADRPAFTLNATSCEPSNAFATLWGAGTVLEPSAETPVGRAARYQAAGCASLGFEPRLGIKLKGGTKRGKFPALRAHYRPKAGEANLKRLALSFPTSAFIEQGHFRTICTRVQFAAGPGHGAHCPKGARYGTARVWSPLIDGPLTGPVILRSSDNNLPDAVLALTGPPSAPIQIEVAVRIDSVKGRLRATVDSAPDAPVSRAIVDMQGGQKGLFVNSRNLCVKPKRNRARANLRGQNGRKQLTKPRVVSVKCSKQRKAKRKRAKRSTGHVARASAVR